MPLQQREVHCYGDRDPASYPHFVDFRAPQVSRRLEARPANAEEFFCVPGNDLTVNFYRFVVPTGALQEKSYELYKDPVSSITQTVKFGEVSREQ